MNSIKLKGIITNIESSHTIQGIEFNKANHHIMLRKQSKVLQEVKLHSHIPVWMIQQEHFVSLLQ